MTTTNNNIYNTTSQDLESLIESLKVEVEQDPSDLVSKISLATVLEQSDKISQAKAVYQEVIAAEPKGSMGAIALKALEGLYIPQSGFLETPAEAADKLQLLPDSKTQEQVQPTVSPRKKKSPPTVVLQLTN